MDATEFFLRDSHGVPAALRRTKQGTYHLDASRCALYLPRTKNFPLNTEVEATLTFAGDEPGQWVKQVTPEPDAITVREHHSFVQLPPAGYKPRVYDPRSSFFGISYMDYATPISEPIVKRFTARHRLESAIENNYCAYSNLLTDPLLVKLRSDFYDQVGQFNGFGRADLLASFALFDDDPKRINDIEAQFRKVTPAMIQKTAQEYLRRPSPQQEREQNQN